MGKTDVLSALAGDARSARRPIEVVSADAMQVYRGMDIGTAKPDLGLRSRLPHHLIDIRNPDEQYDVGSFVEDARAAIEAIESRGALPVVSGGTGYYVKHLVLGLPSTPPSDPEVRERIRSRLEREGLAPLREELSRIDPVSEARIAENDHYRVTRALEVFEQTGRPLSSFTPTGGFAAERPMTLIRLRRPREELAARIHTRAVAMFATGLRDEVVRLVGAGYHVDDPGMRAIGYREFFGDDGRLRPSSEDNVIAAEIEQDTRRYAKRQETFFGATRRALATGDADGSAGCDTERRSAELIEIDARDNARVLELVGRIANGPGTRDAL